MKRFKYLTLAALVAFAACDEGDGDVVAPVTGTISGVVTIEGTAASGVSVALSSGQTATTDASGSYSFTDVSAGAYTVTISGFPSDATFSSTSQAATISSAGEVVTVNFDGSYVRTSAILGSVSGGGSGLQGVTVDIGGGTTTTTDSNGQFSFSGLRAGEYTVSISGFDADQYTFPSTSQTVTVAVGESQTVTFEGQLAANASIGGALYLDENDPDGTFSAQLEDKLAAEGVRITLEGGDVAVFDTIQTDANGDFSFTGLPAGNYRVAILVPDTANVPGNVAFATGVDTEEVVTLTSGESESVYWPFRITQQALTSAVFYGRDMVDPGVAPLSGVTVNLYAQESHAVAGTPILATDTTHTDGTVTFRFPRTSDTSPAGTRDNILFTEVGTMPPNHQLDGESRIEVQYNSKDSLAISPDTFDVVTNRASFTFNAEDGLENPLGGWTVQWFRNDTLAANLFALGSTAAGGADTLDYNPGFAFSHLPDTILVRLSGSQPVSAAAGLTFNSDVTAGTDGEVSNDRTLKVEFDGTQPSFDLGKATVTYTQMNVLARIHHEADDSTDTPVFTGGDDLTGTPTTAAQLYAIDSTGARTTWTGDPGAISPTVGSGTGLVTFSAVPIGEYEVAGRSANSSIDIISDTTFSFTLDGLSQADSVGALMGNAGFSTFAHKYNNGQVFGRLQSVDGATPVPGMNVRIQVDEDVIAPNVTDTTVVTNASGGYRLKNLRDGAYIVSVSDSADADGPVWTFFDTLTTSTSFISGGSDNVDATTGIRDLEGPAIVRQVNFQATRMDTEIAGTVINDRDGDFNTIDPDEALSGITIELVEDLDADGTVDADESVAMSTTTDANGAYSFAPIREGKNWIARAVSPNDVLVLRALATDGSITNTTNSLRTTASPGTGSGLNQNNTRQVGNEDPPAQLDELPRWDYTNNQAFTDGCNLGATGPNCLNTASTVTPTHFIHLFKNGTVQGKLVDGAGDPATGVTVNITLCDTYTAGPPPTSPVGSATGCATTHTSPSPHIQNVSTNANGEYTFTGLLEGVYEVNVSPATGGYSTNVGITGGTIPVLSIVGNGDIETVPDYEVN